MAFRIFLSRLVLLMTSLFSFDAQARIPSLAFKDVTPYFHQGKEFYSPILGITAIEAGLITNLRFYGNYIATYKNDQRDYVNDSSQDPIWQVIHFLFPSPAGNLAAETESPHNFGKHVSSLKTVALLLNYVHQVRTKGTYTPDRT